MSKNYKEKSPKVFISYSQDSPEYAAKILGFANKLRSDGFDAILDQDEESPANGWPTWMDREIENSDFILVVCTEQYIQKIKREVKSDEGLGVKWESILIYQDLYDAGGKNTRVIPVLFKEGKPEYIPKPLRGTTCYRGNTKEGYKDLYWRLRGQAKTKKSKLGKLKPLEVRKPKRDFFGVVGKVGRGDKRRKGYEILTMKDVEKEWDFIIDRVDKYLAENNMGADASLVLEDFELWKQQQLSKVIVHFYHRPKDTEELFINGNRKLLDKGFRILWVFNPEETNHFIMDLKKCMGEQTLKDCAFLKMDKLLKFVPINFTVIAPLHRELPLVYVRFEDLDCAIRIDYRGPTVSLFDKLGLYCAKKAKSQDNKQNNWIPL